MYPCLDAVNISILPKLIYRFNHIPVEFLGGFLVVVIEILVLKFIWKCRSENNQNNFEKLCNKVEEYTSIKLVY